MVQMLKLCRGVLGKIELGAGGKNPQGLLETQNTLVFLKVWVSGKKEEVAMRSKVVSGDMNDSHSKIGSNSIHIQVIFRHCTLRSITIYFYSSLVYLTFAIIWTFHSNQTQGDWYFTLITRSHYATDIVDIFKTKYRTYLIFNSI